MIHNVFFFFFKASLTPLMNIYPLVIFLLIARKSISVDPNFQACSVPKSCGDGQNITFPFYIEQSFCGYPGFKISCDNRGNPVLKLSDDDYIIQEIFYYNQSIRVSNAAVFDTNTTTAAANCINTSPKFQNLTLPEGNFELLSSKTKLFLLYNCDLSRARNLLQYKIGCGNESETNSTLALYEDDPVLGNASKKCKNGVMAPVDTYGGETINSGGAIEMLSKGFLLKWVTSNCSVCEESGGKCGFDENTYQFSCFCHDRPHGVRCVTGTKTNLLRKVVIGLLGASIAVLIVLLAFCIKKKSSCNPMVYRKKKTENYENIEAFLRNQGSLAPKRYSYSDIIKMTSSFKDKLGQGGYGGVYKGRLLDGRLVAVKILNELKGNGEDFINEVASISRTSHVNIVTLLGFCFDVRKRALIYEFVPNGSLEKFIYKDKYPMEADNQLKWEILYKIAVGIAQGLEYLHRGCNTRILHFDIKPHNILLDEDFRPKISDFGLAKICPRNESIISMTGARGTAGYIAPEVFSRNFGKVSHKSDVYSYGMMVLEMVGGRRNINVEVDRTSKIYFPHWVYSRLELEELGLQGIMNEDDKERARKMIIVSLWCIQTNPGNRPPMSRVVNMLEERLDSLQIPPKPFLFSPPGSPSDSSEILVS